VTTREFAPRAVSDDADEPPIEPPGTEGATGGPAPATHHRRDVQGMRAVAVALVVLYHAGVPKLTGGYVGVDVFFVISGFVITNLLLSELTGSGKVSVLRFYGRRAQRIIPLAAVVLVATVVASHRELGFLRGQHIAVDGRWAAAFAANLHFGLEGTDYLGSQLAPSPLQHYWSLSVEEQFYVVWPLLLWLLFRLGGRGRGRHLRPALIGAVAIMAASYAWSIIETHDDATWAYFSTLTRACELMAGAVVAIAATSIGKLDRRIAEAMAVLGLVLIVVSAFALKATTPFPGSVVGLPVLGSALVLAAGIGGQGFVGNRVLGNPVMVLIGDLSFSIYLWHWPLLIIAQEAQSTPLSASDRVALLCGAFLLSCATYFGVENPLRLSRLLKRRPTVSVLNGVVLVGLVLAVMSYEMHNVPGAATRTVVAAPKKTATFATAAQVKALVAAAPDVKSVPSDLTPSLEHAGDDGAPACPASAITLGPGNYCVYGSASATKTIALLGDSHAGEWTYALAPLAERKGYRLYRFSLPACPAPNVHFIAPQTNTPNTACDSYHALAEAKIKALDPDILVVTSSTKQLYDDQRKLVTSAAWAAGLESTIKAAAGPRTKSYVLGDYAYLPINGADCLAAHLSDAPACSTSLASQAAGTVRGSEKTAALAVGATYIDTMPWVCSSRCTAVIGKYLVYKDLYHLSQAYTQYLIGVLSQSLGLGAL
jgi:peptidoglycan/LPS O-acetylase OafA/YrhL